MTDEHPPKRHYPRIPSGNAVLVRCLGGAHIAEGFAKTEVVGLGGCMFVNDEPLGIGSVLEVLISVEGRVLNTIARVVYEIPKDPSHIQVGVEFLEISPEDREELGRLLVVGP
jgi:hypothetical protein